MSSRLQAFFLLSLLSSFCFSKTSFADDSLGLEAPDIDTNIEAQEPSSLPPKKRKKRRNKKAKKESVHSIGLGLSIPDIFPLEYTYKISSKFDFQAFIVPPLPFNIRVELPRDQISSSKGFTIDQPELDIELKAVYGPQFGVGARWKPFASGFYTSLGLGYRKLRIKGSAQSPLIISYTGVETETRTEFGVNVDAVTESLLLRVAIGWRWEFHSRQFLDFKFLGIGIPNVTQNTANVGTFIDAPGDNDDVDGALADLADEKEIELKDKALTEMDPATSQALPILSLSFGFLF